MKKQKQFMIWLFGAFLMLFSINSIAQNPTYLCRIQNAAQVSCNVYEFDVVMQRTGTTTLRLANFQFGILFDAGIRPKGATLNVGMVPGSADALNPLMRPADIKFSADSAKNIIIVTPTPPQGWANSTIISNLAAGTKICRIRVACSKAWTPAINTTHTWSFLLANGYATKIFAYTGNVSPGVNTEITSTGTFSISASPSGNITTTNIGTPPTAQTVTSDITQVCLLPGNGATISLSNSESGYTYYLYKNGTPVIGAGSVAFGYTGNTVSFGQVMTDGVITVKSPGCSGLIDMSNSVTLTTLTPVTASISITASPGTSVSPGTLVTYTATAVNGGTVPSYQWYVNDIPDYVNGMTAIYSYTPSNQDSIYCELISSETCVTPALATSNKIKMVVAIPPTVFNVTGTASYCQGTTGKPVGLDSSQVGVTYTLFKNTVAQTPTVAGTGFPISFGNQLAGTYTVSGTSVGGTSVMTGSAIITETPSAPVSVSIVADQNNICAPAPQVTFTATPTNGGTSPAYQWYVGTTPVGSSSPTYSFTPANGNLVKVVLTSSGVQCATGSPATSNIITMVVNNSLPASVNINANLTTICAGASVNFTATPTNGGTAPAYQWYKNTIAVGSNSSTYNTNTLANNDSVYCMMTSNLACVTGSPAKSNQVKMVVNTPVPVSVSLTVNPDTAVVCLNTAKTFTATPTNGGTSPAYQWYKNGSVVGTNSPTYIYPSSVIATDSVWVRLTSSLGCVSGNPATSVTKKIIVDACIGIAEDPMAISSIIVFPNPTNDKLFINFNDVKEVPQSMRVYNSLGQLCFISDTPLLVNQRGIDVSKYSAGTYTVQIVFEKGLVNKTFIVE